MKKILKICPNYELFLIDGEAYAIHLDDTDKNIVKLSGFISSLFEGYTHKLSYSLDEISNLVEAELKNYKFKEELSFNWKETLNENLIKLEKLGILISCRDEEVYSRELLTSNISKFFDKKNFDPNDLIDKDQLTFVTIDKVTENLFDNIDIHAYGLY